DLPPKPVVHGQLSSHSPSILNVREQTILPLCGICRITYVTCEGLHLTQQEGGQRESTAARARSGHGFERQFARAVRVTGHSQILRMTEIGTELKRMVSQDVSHVTHPLKFVLLLVQRAIALIALIIPVKRISKEKCSSTVQEEGWHTGGIVAVEIQASYTSIL